MAGDDFSINRAGIERILNIAHGNPRLAVMAAKAAINQNDLNVLYDVFDLYEQYFKNAIHDASLFKDTETLKVLGLLSFFNSINKHDTVFFEKMLENFDITLHAFNEAADRLERLEIAEISKDHSVVKITEQVLGTYFFYITFLLRPVLDFGKILKCYFISHTHRLTETIIPVNNTFSYKKVYEAVDPYLTAFWKTIRSNKDIAFKFLRCFWFYRVDDTLAFVFNHFKNEPVTASRHFEFNDQQASQQTDDKDPFLSLLTPLFYHQKDVLTAAELGFACVKMHSNFYQQFIHTCRVVFSFTGEDAPGYERQMTFWKYITDGAKSGDELLTNAFFHIAPELMKTNFTVTSTGRGKFNLSFYRLTLTASEPVSKFRSLTWDTIFQLFNEWTAASKEVIRKYLERTPDFVVDIYQNDLISLFKIFDNYFSNKYFIDCYIVQDTVFWFTRIGIKDRRFTNLKRIFINKTYRCYLLLSRDRYKGRFDFEYDIKNQAEYERWKVNELKSSFVFKNVRQWKLFYKIYLDLFKWAKANTHNFHQSLDIVLAHNLQVDPPLAVSFLHTIINSGNQTGLRPWLVFEALQLQQEERIFILASLTNYDFKDKILWVQSYLFWVPEDEVSDHHVKLLKSSVACANGHVYIDFSYLKKFLKIQPTIFIDMLQAIVDRNEQKDVFFHLYRDFFEKFLDYFKDALVLVQKAYFQQEQIDANFDHDCHDCISLIKLDHKFIIKYVQFFVQNQFSLGIRDQSGLSRIFKMEEAENILATLFDFLNGENNIYYTDDKYYYAFFKSLDKEDKERAIHFLMGYLINNKSSGKHVNSVFRCIDNCFRDQTEDFVVNFLSANDDIEIFKAIKWNPSSMMGSAKVNFSEVRASGLINIFEIISNKFPGHQYPLHKQYLREQILYQKYNAESERRQMFMDGD